MIENKKGPPIWPHKAHRLVLIWQEDAVEQIPLMNQRVKLKGFCSFYSNPWVHLMCFLSHSKGSQEARNTTQWGYQGTKRASSHPRDKASCFLESCGCFWLPPHPSGKCTNMTTQWRSKHPLLQLQTPI